MLCDKCGKNEASVFMKQVINNKQTTQHLCEHCAAELMDIGNLSLGKFFADGVGTVFGSRKQVKHACPVCGMTYAEYNKKGLLGCSECYNTFARELESSIFAIHGKTVHTGKGRLPEVAAPAAAPVQAEKPAAKPEEEDILRQHPELIVMQEKLQELIKEEKFEEAAIVRDQTKAITGGKNMSEKTAE